MAIYNLNQILEIISGWEKDLQDFYRVLDRNLKDDSARILTGLLMKDQDGTVEMLDRIQVEENEELEYQKNLPDYKRENIIPEFKLTELASSRQILDQIFDYEEGLLNIYRNLLSTVVSQHAKDILEMLVQRKMAQIKKIKSCMDSEGLAA